MFDPWSLHELQYVYMDANNQMMVLHRLPGGSSADRVARVTSQCFHCPLVAAHSHFLHPGFSIPLICCSCLIFSEVSAVWVDPAPDL